MNRREFLSVAGLGALGTACNQMGEAAGRAAAKAVVEHLTADKAYPGEPIL